MGVDNLIVKFNDQNGCREEHVKAFAAMPFKNKLFFTIHDWPVTKWGAIVSSSSIRLMSA